MAGRAVPKSKTTVVAVDTNVLLDLARGDETVIDCFDTLRKRLEPVRFVVSPTVMQELADLADNATDGKAREAAVLALQNMVHAWKFSPFNCLPVDHGIVSATGRKLRINGLLPEEEVNDSFVIVEAGLIGATILISSDRHINDIDQQMLKVELDAADIDTPLIASPRRIVRGFFH